MKYKTQYWFTYKAPECSKVYQWYWQAWLDGLAFALITPPYAGTWEVIEVIE